MNVLIVEDEARLRNSLAHNIPWEEHDIDIVGMAENGVQALQLFERKKPDIVLMDIQMPEMDGITLARELQQRDPLVKLIILSGHDNFEFAQRALELGVVKYLLKPAGEEEIVQAVLQAAGQLRGELERLNHQMQLEVRWEQHLPYLRNVYMQQWISGKYDLWEVWQYSHDVQIDLQPDRQYALVVLDMDPLPEGETRFSGKDRPLLLFSLNSIVAELLQQASAWVCTDANEHTVVLFYTGAEEEPNQHLLSVNTTVDRLLAKVKEFLKVSASAGISGSTGGWEDVSKLYAQAGKALQNRKLYGRGIAIPYTEEQQAEYEGLEVQPGLEKSLEIALETGDAEKARAVADELWELGLGKAGQLDEVHEHVLYLGGILIRIIQKQGWRVKEVTGEDYVLFQNSQLLATKEQIQSWLYRSVERIAAYVTEQRKAVSHHTVKWILNMVEEEIDKEITLHTVADRLYVNSSYLSRLFKQETGKTFSTYVLERKMEKAKAALQKGAKVYDAANLVGYRDVSYFTKVFRKYWGVTPREMK
ncbi:two-component system, response regulator YesN [Paenibacillus sp. UNCCL117]|uniref:response regulator transcription factor n=1 Tax=unclassified Paenibacillus TaxID=185978 RepID=UPI00088120A2|nr:MULTISPECIES: response regulator [unclassified Paenibacillus]SDC91084.1 two-component system, response regulator YesN [Paenibacillus sp. cl123]SFW28992.1 two-component system, response regulator YesN [Paenibacillus sp. UNCCL117]